jgi:hypothetical protein
MGLHQENTQLIALLLKVSSGIRVRHSHIWNDRGRGRGVRLTYACTGASVDGLQIRLTRYLHHKASVILVHANTPVIRMKLGVLQPAVEIYRRLIRVRVWDGFSTCISYRKHSRLVACTWVIRHQL